MKMNKSSLSLGSVLSSVVLEVIELDRPRTLPPSRTLQCLVMITYFDYAIQMIIQLHMSVHLQSDAQCIFQSQNKRRV